MLTWVELNYIIMKIMESKQTAVEWLFNQIKKSSKKTDNINNDHLFFYRLLEQAKAIEKEQIKNAWVNAWQESFIEPLDYQFYEPEAEQYYNETYGK